MNVLVTGGSGYVGTMLVNDLLSHFHQVTVLDNDWFGNKLVPSSNLSLWKGDIRELDRYCFNDFDSIIHLANIANDPAVELNPKLSWEVNVLASQQLIEKAVDSDIKQFIFASSGSVYGIRNEEKVTEELKPVPISTYNKTKMIAERVFLSYREKIKVHCVRPATVCGWSPQMRLDVCVNLLTFQALKEGKITVFGGDQIRPNIHIRDLCNVYMHFLENPQLDSGFYNAGFENFSVIQIAQMISKEIPCQIEIQDSNDPRCYRQNSDKLKTTGFLSRYCVKDAIEEIKKQYEKGILQDDPRFHRVIWMKKMKF